MSSSFNQRSPFHIHTCLFDKMDSSLNTQIIKTTPDGDLRKQFVDQFFIYHDYIKNKPSCKCTFQQWLITTECKKNEQECHNRMDAWLSTMEAAKVASEAAFRAAAAAPSYSTPHVTRPVVSSINKPIQPSIATSTPTTVNVNNSRAVSRVFSTSTSSTSTSSSIASSSASATSSSRSKSTAAGRRSGTSDSLLIPLPSSVSEQDVSFFNMKVIEQECCWPMEYKCSTENLTTFKEMICQKVDKVCKYFFSSVSAAGKEIDETARARYLCDGEPFSPTIGWSPYQIYCGIDACHCEKDFGIPHFLYDASSISRDIPYSVLINKDPNNEENMKIKESLYQKMKKENALGKKVWQNPKNRVRLLDIYATIQKLKVTRARTYITF